MADPAPGRPGGPRPLTPLVKLGLGLAAGGAATLAAAPQSWPWVGGVLLADHLVMAAAGIWPRCTLLGPNLSRLGEAAAARGEVAITFDDGPDPRITPEVLEILDRHRAPATFFCIGRRLERYAEIGREAVRRGHAVENHSYRHSNGFALRGPWAMARDVDRAQRAIEAATGRLPALFRAPAGIRNPWLDPILARRSLHLVSWTRRGLDTVDGEPRRVARRLLTGLAAGDVLLLHDRPSRRGDRPPVLDVLPRLLDEIARRGLRPVALGRASVAEAATGVGPPDGPGSEP